MFRNDHERSKDSNWHIMAKKIYYHGHEEVRYYGCLGYLHSGLPRTWENYEKTLEAFFFAATWKRMKWPDTVFEGICITDGKYSTNCIQEEDYSYIQYSYLALCKGIFLPFLYGYDMSSVMNCRIYKKIKKHLIKVRYQEIDTVSDIHEIVEAVINLTKFMNTSEAPDSKYLDKKVDQYILLSQSATPDMIKMK